MLKLVPVDEDTLITWNCAEKVVSLCSCLLDVPWNVRQSHYHWGCISNLFLYGIKEMEVIKAVKSSTELTNALLISHDCKIALYRFKFRFRNLESSHSSYTENPRFPLFEAEYIWSYVQQQITKIFQNKEIKILSKPKAYISVKELYNFVLIFFLQKFFKIFFFQ